MQWIAVIIKGSYSDTRLWYVGTFNSREEAEAHCQQLIITLNGLIQELNQAETMEQENHAAMKMQSLLDPGAAWAEYCSGGGWYDVRWEVGPTDKPWRLDRA